MRNYVYGLILNFQFFSIIPIPVQVPIEDKYLDKAIRMFPLFGILLGGIYAGVVFALINYTLFSPLIITFALWLLLIVITGGIHLDAWIDTSDAFFSYQGPKKRLEIMSDPRVGAFGVISVIVLLVGKFILMYEIISKMDMVTYFLIWCIPFFTRMVMGIVLVRIPTAKEEGLGKLFQQAVKPNTLYFYIIYILLFFVVVYLWLPSIFLVCLVMLFILLLLYPFLQYKIKKWFGGITGDVIGATAEALEVCLWIMVCLSQYFVMG